MNFDKNKLKQVIAVAQDKKGQDILLLDLQGISQVTDYFLIVSGNSTTQVKAITDYLDEKLPQLGIPILRIEGMPEAQWVLIDCGDLVIHVMQPEIRGFYNLERLWGDGRVISFESRSV